jgi:effector-binding domain-containing protein
MSSAPEIETRAEQPYVAVRAKVTMGEIAAFARRFGEVFGWLDGHGLVPAGPPFFKYNVIDMARELEMEAGVPIAAAIGGDDQMVSWVLPAGRYATLTHVSIQVLGLGVAASNRGLRSSVGRGAAVAGERGFRDDCGL